MTIVFNKAFLKFRRKQLRHNMPKAEILLWDELKNKKLEGYKFRRQYSVNSFVIDFYCSKLKIGIEVDGENHLLKKNIKYDQYRQIIIESYGIKILRFNNSDIYNNMDCVISNIKKYLK